MSRLAVMAHYDPRGQVGPHVRRQVEALVDSVEDVVVVTTAQLTPAARRWFAARARLLERPNYGHDFFSYRVGLASVSGLDGYDEVVVCNDSYVGPLRSYHQILQAMSQRPVDFWGLTQSERLRRHVQSFFVAFRPWVVASRAFTSFWADMVPLSDRQQVIRRYEIGMSRALHEAGFTSDAYFQETRNDRRVGRRRAYWWGLTRDRVPRTLGQVRDLQALTRQGSNPTAGLADRALDDGRLPFVKLDTLRFDPYRLDAARLLAMCERKFPTAFEGVRDFLDSTAPHYTAQAAATRGDIPLPLRVIAPAVRYRDPGT